jgi:hypothetical protein
MNESESHASESEADGDGKLVLRSDADGPKPVNTTLSITASMPGELKFAFKILGGPIERVGDPTDTKITVRGTAPGTGVVKAADSKGNTATIEVEFFGVPE